MLLGNLFTTAGFSVVDSSVLWHKWPPFRKTILKIGGWRLFHTCSRIYARLDRRDFQIRIIAERLDANS